MKIPIPEEMKTQLSHSIDVQEKILLAVKETNRLLARLIDVTDRV